MATRSSPAQAASDLTVQVILVAPPAGVDFGVQRGAGTDYETLFTQRSRGGDVRFQFAIALAPAKQDGLPAFKGPFVQGPPAARFIYIDVGEMAGQKDTPWSRRMKVPLHGISWEMIRKATAKPGHAVLAKIPGTASDGGPNCATIKDVAWKVVRAGD